MPILLLALLLVCLLPNGSIAADPAEPLAWESASQFYTAKPGDITARFIFKVVNVSAAEVIIDDIRPSCFCTTAEMPSKPWHLAPKETNQIVTLVDLRGKEGKLFKTIQVVSTNAPKTLTVLIDIPPEAATSRMSKEMADRLFGQQLGALDHQAVFKKDCVKCHLVPAFGKTGENLYRVACGICHEAEHRASMVPDLHALKTEIEANYWTNWVTYGKAGTLMPGFAATEGGPLDGAQITSLVEYLTNAFPRPLKLPKPEPKTGK